MEIEMPKPVVLARKHNLGTSLNCCDIHSISKNQYQVILAETVEKPKKGNFQTYNYLILLCANFTKM